MATPVRQNTTGPRGDADPRRAALTVLRRLDAAPLDLGRALDEAFSKGAWDPRDRRLATEIAYGVARWRFAIDLVIRTATGRRLKDLDRTTRTLLRIGLYQLLYLDRIPASAAVDATVKLAGKNKRKRGFINGTLRGIVRDQQRETGAGGGVPADAGGNAEPFARTYALPIWLARRWWSLGPDAAIARARQANRAAPLTVRVEGDSSALSGLFTDAGLTITPSPVLETAVRVRGDGPINTFPGYANGQFYVQDEASQLVGLLAGAQPGERILDACAAPGGKATQLAAAVGNTGQVVAVEADPDRADLIRENADRLGCDIRVVTADAATFRADDHGGLFDRILLDAPCSGLGVLARHPEGKWWKGEDGIAACARVQGKLLDHLAGQVKPGGSLTYAVCTGEPEETTAQVTRFLAGHPGFSLLPADRIPGFPAGPWVDAGGCLNTNGSDTGMDGFFAAHMVRKS